MIFNDSDPILMVYPVIFIMANIEMSRVVKERKAKFKIFFLISANSNYWFALGAWNWISKIWTFAQNESGAKRKILIVKMWTRIFLNLMSVKIEKKLSYLPLVTIALMS